MVDIERLYRLALEKAAAVKDYRKRIAYEEIRKWAEEGKSKQPALLISGIRGIGKTTLMLQLCSELKNAFYFSADSILVKSASLYAVVEQAYRSGYGHIFIDEVHRYPKWVSELKNIQDDFSAQIIASGSSTAAIKKGSIELGRRAMDFPLAPLTLGEFVYLKEGKRHTATLEDAIDKKKAIQWLVAHPNVERYYEEYLAVGGFPIKLEERGAIYKVVKKMIYEDALAEFSLTENRVDIAERLLGFLAASRLGEFSYTSFSNTSGYAKSTVYEAVAMLKELGILRWVEEASPKSKARGTVKVMFAHPNLRAALAEQLMKAPERGALREEYFVFHMDQLGVPVFLPKKGKKTPDYEVAIDGKKTLFEIGGESKGRKQFAGEKGVVLDDDRLIVLGFVQKTS